MKNTQPLSAKTEPFTARQAQSLVAEMRRAGLISGNQEQRLQLRAYVAKTRQ